MTNKRKDKDAKANEIVETDSEGIEEQEEIETLKWKRELDVILLDENKKIAKPTGAKIAEIFQQLQAENDRLRIKIAYLQGRVDERATIEKKVEEVAAKSNTYAEKLKKPVNPKVGKKVIPPKGKENLVILYPANDNGNGTSARTTSAIKKVLAPQQENLKIRKIVPITRGGILIEAGTEKTAVKIREAAKKAHGIKCVDSKIKRPRLQIFDVSSQMSDEEFLNSLYTQNLNEKGITEKEMDESVKICFRYGKKEDDKCKIIIECTPKIREHLLQLRRVYLEYESCKVADYLVVTRCYQCQQYGHLAKYCKANKPTCSRCGEEGHNHKECRQPKEVEACANCRMAKKESKHRVGTMKCPIYARAVERLVGSIQYSS